jgi:hypothetical protein
MEKFGIPVLAVIVGIIVYKLIEPLFNSLLGSKAGAAVVG